MDLIRLVLYHSRIANADIHGFRIANSEERGISPAYPPKPMPGLSYTYLIPYTTPTIQQRPVSKTRHPINPTCHSVGADSNLRAGNMPPQMGM